MRVLRQVTLLFIAGLVIAAPMLCLQFCELQRYVARPRTSLAEMARLHALSLSERKSQRADHHGDDHAPLVRLKQMVNSVTEFLLALGGAIGASVAVLRLIAPLLRLSQPLLAAPEPPPRLRAIHLTFTS
ncbi:MAG: hypothetical protein KatS3mg052_1845 [Candidatus Roseilinea sp.]|nr:MAG: hypothetical protein KatS3mg052_1845 [Candidatus Roseilinea sp.]